MAAIALFAGVGLAAFEDGVALTIGTSDRDEYHRAPFQEKGVPCHIFSASTDLYHHRILRQRKDFVYFLGRAPD